MEELKKKIWEALVKVIDPELNVSIVGLGLIYSVEVSETQAGKGEALIRMTLTSPGCPLAGLIDSSITECVRAIPEVESVRVEVVWEPPWSPSLMSEEVKAELGMDE